MLLKFGFRLLAIGDVGECSDKVIWLVLVGNTVVPLTVCLKIAFKSFWLAGSGDMAIGPDPVEGIVLDAGKSL